MTHPGGRPTDYKQKYCEEVDRYLEEQTVQNMHMPKVVSFARRIGVHKDTLYEWAKEHKEFSVALSKIMEKQEEDLIDTGIFGGKEINHSIIKLMLMNNHGMREKQDTDVTTGGEKLEGLVVVKSGS
jgi:hypothetical protein